MEKTKLLEGTAPSINLSNWQEKKKRKGNKKKKRIRERKKKHARHPASTYQTGRRKRRGKRTRKRKG